MLTTRCLAHAELVGDEQRTDPVADQVTVALRRKCVGGSRSQSSTSSRLSLANAFIRSTSNTRQL